MNNAEQIFLFTSKRSVTVLFKDFLQLLEELKEQHDESMFALMKELPEDQKHKVVLANHFTEDFMKRARKRVLSSGNDCYRNIEECVKNFNFDLK